MPKLKYIASSGNVAFIPSSVRTLWKWKSGYFLKTVSQSKKERIHYYLTEKGRCVRQSDWQLLNIQVYSQRENATQILRTMLLFHYFKILGDVAVGHVCDSLIFLTPEESDYTTSFPFEYLEGLTCFLLF